MIIVMLETYMNVMTGILFVFIHDLSNPLLMSQ